MESIVVKLEEATRGTRIGLFLLFQPRDLKLPSEKRRGDRNSAK